MQQRQQERSASNYATNQLPPHMMTASGGKKMASWIETAQSEPLAELRLRPTIVSQIIALTCQRA